MDSYYFHMQRQQGSEAEDCRDFLRTGRCKYGASCKYNHPPNVQSGGGLVGPLDPSEPMFPHRPHEPVCQYYMKHRTCKFGQACKFHHPPLSQLASAGNTIPSNSPRRVDAPQLAMNTVGTDATGKPLMVQFLPQRPDEADCIYFLKNGRCKYGATCRYHHPMNYHQQQRNGSSSSRPELVVQPPIHERMPVQYVTQTGPSPGYPQGQYIITDSPVKFMSVDQGQPQMYQSVPVYQQSYHHPQHQGGARDSMAVYGSPAAGTAATEQISSQSSIASSSYTDLNTLETMHDPWVRSRLHGSGGSLKAYTTNHAPVISSMPTCSSDGAIARQRSVSIGCTTDRIIHRSDSNGSWRGDLMGRPPPGVTRPRPRQMSPHRPGDEGFSMMTSVLLNMLDTPEEGAEYGEDDVQGQGYPYDAEETVDPALFQRLSVHDTTGNPIQMPSNGDGQFSYSHANSQLPVWYTAQERTAVGARTGRESPQDSNLDVGLYLP